MQQLETRTRWSISLCGQCKQQKTKFIKRHYNEHTRRWQLLPTSIIYLCINPTCDLRVDPFLIPTWKRVKESLPK